MRQGYRVIDVDTHVTPSSEVLLRYADSALKAREDELTAVHPYGQDASGPGPSRKTDYPILRIRPIPYERIAGQKEGAKVETHRCGNERRPRGARGQPGRQGRAASASSTTTPQGRLGDMDVEGVDVDLIIPGTWACGSSALDLRLARGCTAPTTATWPTTAAADPAGSRG